MKIETVPIFTMFLINDTGCTGHEQMLARDKCRPRTNAGQGQMPVRDKYWSGTNAGQEQMLAKDIQPSEA